MHTSQTQPVNKHDTLSYAIM